MTKADKKVTLFERIKEFVLLGYDNNEIAEALNISNKSKYIQRVRRIVSQYSDNASTALLTLTPQRYYNAIKTHNGTKEELAAKLGVSRMTLHRFEQDSNIKTRLASYMRVRGMSLEKIASTIGTKISVLEKMGLDTMPNVIEIKRQIEIVLKPLADVAQWDAETTTLYYTLKSTLDKLNKLFHGLY